MAGTLGLSSTFAVYVEQTAAIRQETLTTAGLPRGGTIDYFLAEVLAKTDGAGPNTQSFQVFKVRASDGAAVNVTGGGSAFNVGAFGVGHVAIAQTVANGDEVLAAGDQLRVVVNGDATDTVQFRVITVLRDNTTFVTVNAS